MRTDCPFCHHERAALYGAGQARRDGGQWDIYSCDECGSLYPRPRSNGMTMPRAADGVPTRSRGDDDRNDPRRPLAPESLAWRVKRLVKPIAYPHDVRHYLRRRIELGGEALDIGADDGRFCVVLESLGYRAIGLEPRGDAAGWARRHGVEVYEGSFPDAIPDAVAQRRYDLISCMESICYFIDIDAALASARDLLKPDGILLIKMLNGRSTFFTRTENSLAYRYGDSAQAMPTPGAIGHWVRASGFEVLDVTGGVWTPEPESGSPAAAYWMARARAMSSGLILFGRPLFDIDMVEAVVVLARKSAPGSL